MKSHATSPANVVCSPAFRRSSEIAADPRRHLKAELHTKISTRLPPRRFAAAALLASLLFAAPLAQAQDEPIPPNVQSAVDRGLDWLAKNQDPSTGAFDKNGVSRNAVVAVTSLAAMAFMARGHVPGQGPYGDTINRAVDYVISIQQADGLLSPERAAQPMYDHGIATVMLCEAYGQLDERRQKQAMNAINNAVRLILNAQNVHKDREDQGGWRYQPSSHDSDISVTGWQLMALRGAANAGANIPASAIQAGIAYVKSRTSPSGAFTYPGGRADAALTGTGILALELLGQHHSKEALAGGDYLLAKKPDRRSNEFYFYTVYYCSQAAWQLGGHYWEALNPVIRQSLLQGQRSDGSWSVTNTNENQGGQAYATSMAILALTVPYRYLPIYQK